MKYLSILKQTYASKTSQVIKGESKCMVMHDVMVMNRFYSRRLNEMQDKMRQGKKEC